MKPAPKHISLEKWLEEIAGRSTAIESDHCVAPPLGCGKAVAAFRDGKSLREYVVSGLCQECQDNLFGTEED